MPKSKLAKLIIPYLNHVYQSRFELLVMLNISHKFLRNIFRRVLCSKIATLHTLNSLKVNYITDCFLQILQSFQNSCL